MHLQRHVDGLLGCLGREQLGHGGLPRGPVPGVAGRRRVVHEQPGRLQRGRGIGQRMAHPLQVLQGPPERPTVGGPVQRRVDGRLPHPDGRRPDAGTEEVEGLHRYAEPVVDLAEHGLGRHVHPVQLDPPDGVRGDQRHRCAGQPRGVTRHRERRHATRPGIGGRAGEERVDVGVRGVRDPLLHPGEAVPAVVRLGPQRQRRRVGAGIGLGQGEGGHRLTTGDGGDPPPHDLGAPRLQDRVGPQPLDGEGRLRGRAHAGHGLPQHAQLRGRRSGVGGPAEVGGEQPREQSVLGQRGHQAAVHPSGIAGVGDGPQHLPGELTDLAQQPLPGVGEQRRRCHGLLLRLPSAAP